jgi:hypothetical protein
MRKQYRIKRRSCAMCKPNKMGWANRFTSKEQGLQKVHDKEIKDTLQRGQSRRS